MRIALIALVLVLVGAGCWGLTFIDWSVNCPKGQSLREVSTIVVIGKYGTTVTPIFACEAS